MAIVGAGPIGLELAVALKRAGVDYQHFDAKQIGYTISWFAPGTRFFSSNERIAIAGVPLQTPDQGKATREQYLAYLRGVVQQFDLRIHTYESLVGLTRENDGFLLSTRPVGREPRQWRARRVVLATGGTDRPRPLNIPGESLPHVSAYFQDPHLYFRKRLLIVGGKNSAVEAALRSHQAGASVSLSYRQSQLSPQSIKYWLLPEINDLLKTGKMTPLFETVPTRITPGEVTLARVAGGGESQTLPFDFVLKLIGYEQDNSLLRLAGVELSTDCGAPLLDPATMETSVPGLYVAGTAVAGTQDKYRVFIENCHIHVDRILASLRGTVAPTEEKKIALPES